MLLRRAIRSGLAIHSEITRFSERMTREKGITPLRMRVGIHSGPVVVGTVGNDLRVEFKALGGRMPAFLRPKAIAYGHIIAIESNGKVLEDLQDPAGAYPLNTSVTETPDYLYIGSLVTPFLGKLQKAKAGV